MKILALFFLLSIPIRLYAVDIGGRLEIANILSGRLEVDANVDIGEFGNLSIGGEFYFPFLLLADLSYLTFLGEVGFAEWSQLSIQLGRFEFMDPTNRILFHKLDGGRFNLQVAFLSAGLAVGYTGLLFNNVTYNIVSTKLDDADVDDDSKFFAPKRLIGIADLRVIGLIWRQEVYVSAVLNMDLRDENELTNPGRIEDQLDPEDYGGRLTTNYWSLGMTGTIGNSPILFYNLYGTLQFGETLSNVSEDATRADLSYEPIRAYLAGLNIGLAFPTITRHLIEGEFLISSGDGDYSEFIEGNRKGTATQFIPISQTSSSSLFSATIGNLGYVLVRYSFHPFARNFKRTTEEFQFFTSTTLFFRPTDAPISIEEVGANTGRLLVLEGDVGFNWEPFSDMRFNATIAAGLPLYSGSDQPLLVNLELIGSLSF